MPPSPIFIIDAPREEYRLNNRCLLIISALFALSCFLPRLAQAITLAGTYSGIVFGASASGGGMTLPAAYLDGSTFTGSFSFGPTTTTFSDQAGASASYEVTSDMIDLNFTSATYPDQDIDFNYNVGNAYIKLNETSHGQGVVFQPIDFSLHSEATLKFTAPENDLFQNFDINTLAVGPSITSAIAAYGINFGGSNFNLSVDITQLTIGDKTITLPFNPPPVPLPPSWALMISAIAGLGGVRLVAGPRRKLISGPA